MKTERAIAGWAIKWRSENHLDGKREYLLGGARHERPSPFGGYKTMVFETRREARQYINKHYGYMRRRKDLRDEPHGWRMPSVVKVRVMVQEA